MDKYLINDPSSELLLKTNQRLPYRVIMISFVVPDYSLQMSLLTLKILNIQYEPEFIINTISTWGQKFIGLMKFVSNNIRCLITCIQFSFSAMYLKALRLFIATNCPKIVHDSVVGECPGHSSWYVKLSEIIRNLPHCVQHTHGQIQTMYPQDNCVGSHHVLPGIIWSLQIQTQ